MAGLLDFISNPTPRDVAFGRMLGLDPRALKQQALSNAALQAGIGMLNASGPSPYPVGWGKGLGMGLGGFAQGYRGAYSDALREGVTTTALGRAKRQGEREDELDRLRQAAILEAQTKGLPIPSREAGYAMDGRMVDPNDPKAVPVRGMLGANPIDPQSYDPISASPLVHASLAGEIDKAVGLPSFAKNNTGSPRDGIHPVRIETTGRSHAAPPRTDMSGFQGATGLPPALSAYLLHSNPATFAQMQRPHVLSRGAKMVDARGRTIAEGGSPFPQVRNFTVGSETIPHQYDETTGQWVPIEGAGGPRFSPRYRGELTPAQHSSNAAIDFARQQLAEMDLASPEAIMQATTQFTPTGRPNPQYRKGIASLVRKATQRKIGDDPDYEGFVGSVYGSGGAPRERPAGDGSLGLRPGFLTGQEGGEQPRGTTAALPMTGGKIDRMRLKHGETYELPDGGRAKWDSQRKGFEIVE